jgi:hypothetical protein
VRGRLCQAEARQSGRPPSHVRAAIAVGPAHSAQRVSTPPLVLPARMVRIVLQMC